MDNKYHIQLMKTIAATQKANYKVSFALRDHMVRTKDFEESGIFEDMDRAMDEAHEELNKLLKIFESCLK